MNRYIVSMPKKPKKGAKRFQPVLIKNYKIFPNRPLVLSEVAFKNIEDLVNKYVLSENLTVKVISNDVRGIPTDVCVLDDLQDEIYSEVLSTSYESEILSETLSELLSESLSDDNIYDVNSEEELVVDKPKRTRKKKVVEVVEAVEVE